MKLRIALGAVAAILLAALIVPWIDAGPYRMRVQFALERALGRRVELSGAQLRLLPWPGFTASDVTIAEDPVIGAEAAAYVGTLRATPRILPLFAGRLEFSSVDLEDASLNITRVDRSESGVHWNFATVTGRDRLAALPSVHMRDGRINFKLGDTKSILYLLDTDVDLWPPSSASGPWTFRVRAEPARTDRPARGFGSVDLRGIWQARDNSAELDVRLEKSELGDMLTLLNGYESGIQGSISGTAHLAGPLSHVGIAGRVAVANLHGWSQTPPGGNEWPLEIGGILDMPGQTLDFTAKVAAQQTPFEFHYRVADYLKRPRWGVTVNLRRFPLSPLVGIARNLGWSIPADFKLEGTANGAVSFSIPRATPQMNGQLSVSGATFAAGNGPQLRVAKADLRFAGTSVTLAPAAITNDRSETAMLEGLWDSETRILNAAVSTSGMAIASLGRQIPIAGIPILSQATDGAWSGNLQYTNRNDSRPAGWTGEMRLENTVVPFEAFAAPLRILSAEAAIADSAVTLKRVSFAVGELAGRATYRYDASSARPHRFQILLARANAGAIEQALMPTLHRGNLLTYAFSFGRAPMPNWLRNMRAEGSVEIGALDLADAEFDNVHSDILWDGMQVRLPAFETWLGEAEISGAATVLLDRREPAYSIDGRLAGMPWRSGTVDAEIALVTRGIGLDLVQNLHAKGSFEGERIDLTPLDEYESVVGAFDCEWDGRIPRLRVNQLIMKSADNTVQGTADTLENGDLLLRLTDGTKHIETAGALLRGDALRITP